MGEGSGEGRVEGRVEGSGEGRGVKGEGGKTVVVLETLPQPAPGCSGSGRVMADGGGINAR